MCCLFNPPFSFICPPLCGSYVGNGFYSSDRLNGNPNMSTLTKIKIPILLLYIYNRFTQICPNICTRECIFVGIVSIDLVLETEN